MITGSETWRGDRVLRIAVVLSLFVHLAAAGLYFGAARSPLARLVRPRPQPTEAFVTISDAFHFDKRAVPSRPSHRVRPHRRVVAHRPVRPVPPQPVPAPPQRVAAVPPAPPTPAPRRARHELTKAGKSATRTDARTVRALALATNAPTVPPATRPPAPVVERPAPTPAPRTKPRPVAVAAVQPHAERPHAAHPRFTQEQLAQIQQDLTKTIAQTRAAENPLRVPRSAPAAPKHYQISVSGAPGKLRGGEGLYSPRGPMWRGSDGYDYYYVSYEFQYEDGNLEQGDVPWPVRFAPSADPFAHPELVAIAHLPLPPPLPEFRLPPGYRLGKALRVYFPGVYGNDGN